MMFSLRVTRCLASVALTAIAAASPALAQSPTVRDLSVEPLSLAEVTVPESDLKVTAWVDRRNDTYRPGDTLTLSIRTNRDAFVSVVNVGSSGRVTVLFPNKHAPSNRVAAHQVVQLPADNAPYRIKVGGPSGYDLLKIIATARPHKLTDPKEFAELGPFLAYRGSVRTLARDLSVELKEHVVGPERGAAVADKVIRIVGAE
jgi:hypothetical protein